MKKKPIYTELTDTQKKELTDYCVMVDNKFREGIDLMCDASGFSKNIVKLVAANANKDLLINELNEKINKLEHSLLREQDENLRLCMQIDMLNYHRNDK